MKIIVNEDRLKEQKEIFQIDKEFSQTLVGKASIDKPWLKFYPNGVSELELPKKTLYQNFFDSNINYPSQTIISFFGTKITVKQLLDKVENAKKVFCKQGIKNGDAVSIAMLTTPEFVISCFALNNMGVRIDMVDFVSGPEVVKEQMKNCNNKKLILLEEMYDLFADFIDDKEFDTIITTSLFDSMPFPIGKILKSKSKEASLKANKKQLPTDSRFIQFRQAMQQCSNLPSVVSAPYENNKEAFSVYSSGSASGIPTAYVITNDSINATIFDHVNADMSFARGQIYLNVLPAIYSTTITSSLFLPLILGVTVELDPRFDKNIFAKQIKNSKANHFIVNASHGEALLRSDVNLSNLIYPIIGGEGIDESVEQEFCDKLSFHYFKTIENPQQYKLIRNVKYILKSEVPNTDLTKRPATKLGKGYGASQFGACVTVTNERCNKIGSVGIPLPHATVAIFDPDTNEELGYNCVGEIRVISPSSIKRVFSDSEGKDKIFKINPSDGKVWGHSGDIGYLDEDGCLYIKGRMDDSYVKDGDRKYPYQIESVLKSISFLKKSKVLRVPTDNKELNIAYIVLEDNHELCLTDMISSIFQECIQAKENIQLDAIRLCSEFPIASSGKINTVELRKNVDMLITFDNDTIAKISIFDLLNHSTRVFQLDSSINQNECEQLLLSAKQKKIGTN